jgi:RimJ/RimL family protein N-acetyltransferase
VDIRAATIEDCGLLWIWANDPIVRLNSFNHEYIKWDDHIAWFKRKLASPNCQLWIVVEDSEPMAVVRFDIAVADNIISGDGLAEISVTVAANWRGQGRGAAVIKLASAMSRLPHIVASIKAENIASLKAFSGAGYVKSGETIKQGQKTILLALDKSKQV